MAFPIGIVRQVQQALERATQAIDMARAMDARLKLIEEMLFADPDAPELPAGDPGAWPLEKKLAIAAQLDALPDAVARQAAFLKYGISVGHYRKWRHLQDSAEL